MTMTSDVNFLLNSFAALAPGALFGLATFSHKMGLYDVQGPIPVVKNMFIPSDTEGTLPIELEDAMPLLQFLAPVYWSYYFGYLCIIWLLLIKLNIKYLLIDVSSSLVHICQVVIFFFCCHCSVGRLSLLVHYLKSYMLGH